jgi:hypothetical protein
VAGEFIVERSTADVMSSDGGISWLIYIQRMNGVREQSEIANAKAEAESRAGYPMTNISPPSHWLNEGLISLMASGISKRGGPWLVDPEGSEALEGAEERRNEPGELATVRGRGISPAEALVGVFIIVLDF